MWDETMRDSTLSKTQSPTKTQPHHESDRSHLHQSLPKERLTSWLSTELRSECRRAYLRSQCYDYNNVTPQFHKFKAHQRPRRDDTAVHAHTALTALTCWYRCYSSSKHTKGRALTCWYRCFLPSRLTVASLRVTSSTMSRSRW